MIKRILLGLFCLVFVLFAYAGVNQPLKSSVYLLGMKSKQLSEKRGDEIYMTVTAYPSDGSAKHYNLPNHPLHWSSEHLEKIKNFKLWENGLNLNQEIKLVFTLVEKDVHPWNPDDLLGTVELTLKNENGRIQAKWQPGKHTSGPLYVPTEHGAAEQFDMKGKNGHYIVNLSLRVK